jgi:hypothetical protein
MTRHLAVRELHYPAPCYYGGLRATPYAHAAAEATYMWRGLDVGTPFNNEEDEAPRNGLDEFIGHILASGVARESGE